MLKKVDPTNVVLIDYMSTIDPKVDTGKLLPKAGAGSSKKSRNTKKLEVIVLEPTVKDTKTSKSPKTKADEKVSKVESKPVVPVEPVVSSPTSVTIPLKTGVLRQLRLKYGGSPTSSLVRKPHLTHQGVLIREIPAPVSPHSKKQRVEDMAKKISKKKKNTKKRK
ncbi:unnamed protein product [Lactuca saligna]|uniref:Uncharacterized protein n=1 Tax=Lactuca saligna TaxID=75948 RepID=A0AA35V6F7_LACSI|nr:unnamed protein product [Lactuca saligna]